MVLYSIGLSVGERMRNLQNYQNMPRMTSVYPVRVNALHICYNSFLWEIMWSIVKVAAPFFTKPRIRTHYGM